MANNNPPKKNQAFTTAIALSDTATAGRLKANPTLATGDFKVSIDGAGLNNLGTLPVVVGTSTEVTMTLSAAEMNGDRIYIRWIDQTTPAEWADGWICILTTA